MSDDELYEGGCTFYSYFPSLKGKGIKRCVCSLKGCVTEVDTSDFRKFEVFRACVDKAWIFEILEEHDTVDGMRRALFRELRL